MLKVLIADDEKKICQLIEKLVDWETLGMEVAAFAADGIEAMEKVKEHHPDIVITDIRMPGLDGLELVRLGKEFNPRMEFVIISGYRHFEYAQTAIRHGVSNYILKPIKKEELTESLGRLAERFREKTEQLSYEEKVKRTLKSDTETIRKAFLSDIVLRRNRELLKQPLETLNQEFHYSFRPGNFCTAILKMDSHVFDDERNWRFMADKVRNAIGQQLEDCVWEQELLFVEGFCYVLLNFETETRPEIRRRFRGLLDQLRVQGGILENFSVTIALGTVCERLEELEASLKNARLLIEERLIAGTGKLLDGELSANGSFAESEEFTEFNGLMSQALESLEVFAVREAMLKLKSRMLSLRGVTGHEILQMTREVCNLYLFFMKNYRIRIEEDFLESYNAGADNCASAAELFDYMIRRITASYEKAAKQKRQDENRPVRSVKKYVSEHYNEPLSLEQVSEVARLSPAYLSTIFKKDTGMTFLEYVSKVRMDMAKQLLKETNLTVADICGRVGYSDVRYFTKTFAKYSGLKPNEYRKLYS